MDISLTPVTEADLDLLSRFLTEPGLIGLDWAGYRDPRIVRRRFAEDSWLGKEDGRFMVRVGPAGATDATDATGVTETAGFVGYRAGTFAGPVGYWEIGIALLPEWRGRGAGWRAQAMLCDYLFRHSAVRRIQAGTHPENTAEQRALVRAGFTLEGVVRAAEFRDGGWHDGYLYSRLRDDPAPDPTAASAPSAAASPGTAPKSG